MWARSNNSRQRANWAGRHKHRRRQANDRSVGRFSGAARSGYRPCRRASRRSSRSSRIRRSCPCKAARRMATRCSALASGCARCAAPGRHRWTSHKNSAASQPTRKWRGETDRRFRRAGRAVGAGVHRRPRTQRQASTPSRTAFSRHRDRRDQRSISRQHHRHQDPWASARCGEVKDAGSMPASPPSARLEPACLASQMRSS